jgi:dUTP pyrophosphatase
MNVQILLLDHASPHLPQYESDGAAGMDIRAGIKPNEQGYPQKMTLYPNQRIIVPTGITVAIPPGFEIQVRSRSGLAAKNGIFVLNTPGTIDADYRGEIKVILHNISDEPFVINHGDRIAQMVLCPVIRAVWEPVETLPETVRGTGHFGSTGV